LKTAYAFARATLKGMPDPLKGHRGHRLVWVRRGAYAGIPLIAHSEAFTVAGRHTQCGLSLPADPTVALRHLLIRSIPLANGKAGLRALDLHTENGFDLPDGTKGRSIFAEGPVVIGVGEYAVVALPSETPDDALPNELPAPEVDTPAHVKEQIAAMEKAIGPYRANPRLLRTNNHSRISIMPNLVMLGESQVALGRLATGSRWAVTLERQGHTASVTVTADELKSGVVIGRSEKCHSENLRRITDTATSRVHVLLLCEGEKIQAFDLASTHGVSFDGKLVRRVDLADEGTVLLLGHGPHAVRLFWRRAS
jgi:hypothetical protein